MGKVGTEGTYCKAQKGPQTTVNHSVITFCADKICQELRMVNAILTSNPKTREGERDISLFYNQRIAKKFFKSNQRDLQC